MAWPSVVLDSEALSRIVRRDRAMLNWVCAARQARRAVLASAATLVEAVDPKANRAAAAWGLSLIQAEPVTKDTSDIATGMLRAAGVHGHTHALDALVAATAAQTGRQAIILTSDVSDLERLAGGYDDIMVCALP
jgi:predicted nucleic acid-binding protein